MPGASATNRWGCASSRVAQRDGDTASSTGKIVWAEFGDSSTDRQSS
jgi:hypothetical protein